MPMTPSSDRRRGNTDSAVGIFGRCGQLGKLAKIGVRCGDGARRTEPPLPVMLRTGKRRRMLKLWEELVVLCSCERSKSENERAL